MAYVYFSDKTCYHVRFASGGWLGELKASAAIFPQPITGSQANAHLFDSADAARLYRDILNSDGADAIACRVTKTGKLQDIK